MGTTFPDAQRDWRTKREQVNGEEKGLSESHQSFVMSSCLIIKVKRMRDLWAEASELLTRRLGHRGYWRLLQISPSRGMRLRKDGAFQFQFDSGDRYWARLRAPKYEYEPELKFVFDCLTPRPFAFLDLGANIGFWASWVGAAHSPKKIVAVEANSRIHRLLSDNLERNAPNAHIVHALVAGKGETDRTLHIPTESGGHASASALDSSLMDSVRQETVKTRTLDELLISFFVPSDTIVVKLDIEGLEAEVLESSELIRKWPLVLIYEEHGSRQDCKATQLLLDSHAFELYLLASRSSRVRIREVSELRKHMKLQHKGYNVLAVSKRAREFLKV